MSQTELARIAFQALMNDVTDEAASSGRKEYPLSTSLILRRSTALAAADSTRARVSKT
jgi:hypothetical protein